MKIKSHSESHIVELADGSRWKIFPGDLDATLSWTPETDITLIETSEGVGSHALVSDAGAVRAIPADQSWPEGEVRRELKKG